MKRVSSDILRLGFTKNWKFQLNVLNPVKAFVFLLKSSRFLLFFIGILSRYYFRKIFPIYVFGFVSLNKIILFAYVYWIASKIKMAKKPKWLNSIRVNVSVTHKSLFYIYLRYFIDLLYKKYTFFVSIVWKNFFKLSFYNKFLRSFHRNLFKIKEDLKLGSRFLYSALAISLFYRDVDFLSLLVVNELRKRKNHGLSLKILTSFLSSILIYNYNTICIIIRISGRWNNAERSRTKTLMIGEPLSLQSFDLPLNYSFRESITPIGVFGVKVWLL